MTSAALGQDPAAGTLAQQAAELADAVEFQAADANWISSPIGQRLAARPSDP